MPEYFSISFIIQKSLESSKDLLDLLNDKYEICEGENVSNYFGGKSIVLTSIFYDTADFLELCVGIPNQLFYKNYFNEELNKITTFVYDCFTNCNKVQFALCSYELNGYLLGKLNNLNQFNSNFLKKFPIYYYRKNGNIFRKINLKAQNIFT